MPIAARRDVARLAFRAAARASLEVSKTLHAVFGECR
jgi:hypothetical protein